MMRTLRKRNLVMYKHRFATNADLKLQRRPTDIILKNVLKTLSNFNDHFLLGGDKRATLRTDD